MKSVLGITEALYLKPLLYRLEADVSPFDLKIDLPSKLALDFSQRIPLFEAGCAFLSPIDYARHGAEYRIVPDVCVASSVRTNTIQLFIKSDVHNIKTISVDVRVTSEILLAKIILLEKYRNLASGQQFIPMMPNPEAMLRKADAALVVNFSPVPTDMKDAFVVDLVEEWNDLTELPYVHGFWVGREDRLSDEAIQRLVRSKQEGLTHLDEVISFAAKERNLPPERCKKYFSSFSFNFGEAEYESLSEFTRFAFYFGVLPDIPEIHFFELDTPPKTSPN